MRASVAAGLFLALAMAAAGVRQKAEFDYVPGPQLPPPDHWPAVTSIARPAGPMLLVFVHPDCECTAATLHELARVLANSSVRPPIRIVVSGRLPNAHSDWRERFSLPSYALIRDESGAEAARFGALTSGTVFLFSAEGTRLFSGGITPFRGHEGPSRGQVALRTSLNSGVIARGRMPVFGCALFSLKGNRQ